MIAKVLTDIGNVSVYPVITLVIFFSVFTVMLIIVMRGNKARYAELAALPLDGVKNLEQASHNTGDKHGEK